MGDKKKVISSCSRLDARLLNGIFSDSSDVPDIVQSVEVASLGEGVGLLSDLARATLSYASATPRSPASMIVKCAAQAEVSKAKALALNFYGREVDFYKHLAGDSPIRVPHCYYSEIDEASSDFLILLEDLGSEGAGDQLVGADENRIGLVLDRAAEFHAKWWDKTDAAELSWLAPAIDARVSEFRRDEIFGPGVEPTIEGFPEYFTDDSRDFCRRCADQYVELHARTMSGADTIIHGDLRVDNMFFRDIDGAPGLIVFDWQACGRGNGVFDVAYFMSQCVAPELRRKVEMESLQSYHRQLLARGVRGYSFDDALRDYRLALLMSLHVPFAVCGATLDTGNERGLELGKVMLERGLAAVSDLDCADLLD